MKKRTRIPAINFAVTVNGAPVEVVANPFVTANDKMRFRVSYNGSPIHIFEWNEVSQTIEVIDSASETIPLHIEQVIGDTLLHRAAA
ncbi:MAG: hypothetical protein V4717_19395 [Bacteroidota bacterium]